MELDEVDTETKPFPSTDGCANAFLKLSLMASAGFLPGAPKLSAPPTTLAAKPTLVEVTPAKAIIPAGFKLMLALACAATSSGGSPCKSLTLQMSTSSLARVLAIISISLSAKDTFSAANSCISVYDADIFVGMGTGFPEIGPTDSALDEGESGTGVEDFPEGVDMVVIGIGVEAEDARLEWRMYRALSLSISCCSSSNVQHNFSLTV